MKNSNKPILNSCSIIVSIIGLGYVGMPLALSLAQYVNVVAYDIEEHSINRLKNHEGYCQNIAASTNPEILKAASFHIIAVPTPTIMGKPDLSYLMEACRALGSQLCSGSVVVIESTVYPGTTEDICSPILENISGLSCGSDFKIAYCPERVNVGDMDHQFNQVCKVISGIDLETIDRVMDVYSLIQTGDFYVAKSIRDAELIKVAENTQRDLNIAFMNTLAKYSHFVDNIDLDDVIAGMNTKWNALHFFPGLVGGHCIGVDTNYLIDHFAQIGFQDDLTRAARKTNEDMVKFVFNKLIDSMQQNNLKFEEAVIAFFGISFKRNCDDIRNSKSLELAKMAKEKGCRTILVDPLLEGKQIEGFGKVVSEIDVGSNVDVAVVSSFHKCFSDFTVDKMRAILRPPSGILFDLENSFRKECVTEKGITYWSLAKQS